MGILELLPLAFLLKMSALKIQQIKKQLDEMGKILTRMEAKVGGAGAGGAGGARSEAYEEYLDEYLKPLLDVAGKLDDDIKKGTDFIANAFRGLGELIKYAEANKKPASDTELGEL